jgi:hypothetical protein
MQKQELKEINYLNKNQSIRSVDIQRRFLELEQQCDLRNPPEKKIGYQIEGIDFLSDDDKLYSKVQNRELEWRTYVHMLMENEHNLQVKLDLNLDCDFIYFPLHYEPEKTTNPEGGHYYDVYNAVCALRHFVPKEIPIYIKEHPTQLRKSLKGYVGRSPYFYRSVSVLPNVYFVPQTMSSIELINKSLIYCISNRDCTP